jgi:transposase
MEDEQRQEAKRQMMILMQAGHSWQEASTLAGVPTSRSTAYRWFQRFCAQGEAALHDGRHGHTAKMHRPIRGWLEARCREEPSRPRSSLQKELRAHFGVLVSSTHLNRIRAAYGVARQPARMGKNQDHSSAPERYWQDGAGGLLLVAAVHETGLLAH